MGEFFIKPNKTLFIVLTLLILTLPLVFGQDNNGGKADYFPPGQPDGNWVEYKAKSFVRIDENGFGELVVEGQEDERVFGQEDCDYPTGDEVFDNIYYSYLEFQGDEDWYRGFRAGRNTLKFVLVPPHNKDYDIEIFDACPGSVIKRCTAGGTGAIEECTADVTDYFYIRVYGYNLAWNNTAFYYINAHPYGSCSSQMQAGTPSKAEFACRDNINVNNTRVSNPNNDGLNVWLFRDLWNPSGNIYDYLPPTGFGVNPYGNNYFNASYSPPQNGWQENGSYNEREFVYSYCASTGALTATKVHAYPRVNCIQCDDECSYVGEKRCNGQNSEVCGNYDGDPCLEWGNPQYCPNGCSNGQCNQCSPHSYSACFDNDRYWYNSCNQREDLRQDCGNTSYGPYICFDNDVYQDVTERGCQSDACYSRQERRKVSECGAGGCSNGQCNQCQSHHHEGCFDNDIYWFNSCNEREEKKEDCRVACVVDGEVYCNNGCLGNFAITVKNVRGQAEQNATVSFRYPNQPEFQFAGLTNQDGRLDFSHVFPYNWCNVWYDVKAVTANGADCGVRTTKIDPEGDRDGIMFTCPIVNNDNFLRVAPDGPERIKLGQILDLRALIRDKYYTPVSNALVGVNRPYDPTPLSDQTDDQGNATFIDDRVPAGSHNFQFIGSKVNYNYGEAWKRVTVEPQQVYTAVRDNLGNPVWHAEILIEGVSKGFTDNQGKLAIQVTEQVNTLEAKNTDGIHCGYRTVRIGEQGNFICSGNPVVRVEVDNNYGLQLSGVVIAVDGEFVDFTNAFGYTTSTISSGEHLIEIYYQLDENSQKYLQQQRININRALTVVGFVADEEQGIPIDGKGMALNGSEIRAQCPFCLVLIPVAFIALDFLSMYWSVEGLCECFVRETKSPDFNQSVCMDTIFNCVRGGVSTCKPEMRRYGVNTVSCPLEYGGILVDASPATGAGIITKVGKVAFAVKIANRFPMKEIWLGAKHIGEVVSEEVVSETIKVVRAKTWNYILRADEAGNVIKTIALHSGTELSFTISKFLDDALANPFTREASKKAGKMLEEFGEFIGEWATRRVQALTYAIRDLGDILRGLEKNIHKYIDSSPEGQGDSIIVSMFKSGDFDETTTKKALELTDDGAGLKNIEFTKGFGNNGKDADNLIKIPKENGGETKYWIDSTSIESELVNEQNLYSKLLDGDKRQFKFQDLPSQDGIQVVRLDEGTSLTKQQIESTLAEVLPDMPGTQKLKVYDTITGNVYWWPK